MLSDMESDREARELLDTVERAGAAPYLDYPPVPVWWPPAAGAWSALLVLAFSGLDDSKAIAVPLLLVLFGLEGAFFAWYRRRSGVMPSFLGAPREIDGAYRRYFVGVVLVVAACVLVYVVGGPWWSAGVAFLTVTIGLAWYERAYRRAAEATRRRLS